MVLFGIVLLEKAVAVPWASILHSLIAFNIHHPTTLAFICFGITIVKEKQNGCRVFKAPPRSNSIALLIPQNTALTEPPSTDSGLNLFWHYCRKLPSVYSSTKIQFNDSAYHRVQRLASPVISDGLNKVFSKKKRRKKKSNHNSVLRMSWFRLPLGFFV